ncbi:MAG: hypothetical protein LC657_04140, partial [Desulfobacteraceae bacterium]|nr:hypothetical protein [Desulfobacteraceae bacterium]
VSGPGLQGEIEQRQYHTHIITLPLTDGGHQFKENINGTRLIVKYMFLPIVFNPLLFDHKKK